MANRKLAALMPCIGMALIASEGAQAKGNTVRRSEPHVVEPDSHKTHRWAPVRVYSAAHHHYHLTHHPGSGR